MQIESAQSNRDTEIVRQACKGLVQLIHKDETFYLRVGLRKVYFYITLEEMTKVLFEFTDTAKHYEKGR